MVLVDKKSFFKTMIASFTLMNDHSRDAVMDMMNKITNEELLNNQVE